MHWLTRARPSSLALLGALLIVLALTLVRGPAEARTSALGPEPETFALDNGLEVVVLPDHRAPVVTHMIWYRVGAADEPPGKSGIAHFLEHLMFRGTAKVPPGEFSKTVARNGGQDNAFTTQDYTAYFQRVAVDRLPLVMELEADRMRNLVLSDEIVKTERKVILEERRSRIDNDPGSLMSEQMMAALYLSHPYGIPTIGWYHEMEQLGREDALAFYNRFYEPNNAILVVAGDVTAATVRPLAEQYFGAIPRGPEITRTRPSEPPQRVARHLRFVDSRVELNSFSRFYLAPSYTTAQGETAHALDVMVTILGGGETSWLYRKLVVEQKLATSAGAWYDGSALNDSQLGLYAQPRDGVTLEALEQAIDAVIAEFLAKGPAPGEMERAKAQLVAAAVYARDSQEFMARIYGVGLTTGQTIKDILGWPRRIETVKARDVVAAARLVLDPVRSVTGYLEPETSSPPPSSTQARP